MIGKKEFGDSPSESLKYFDFRKEKTIGQDIDEVKKIDKVSGGYDHIWVFGENNKTNDITLKNSATDIQLKVTSDADAVIMYANCYPKENIEFNPSGVDTLNAGITIEPIKFFTRDKVGETLNINPSKEFTRNITYTFSDISTK